MDAWMVAVAAGAGYIAQHFKKNKEASGQIASESSTEGSIRVKSDSPKPPPNKKCPFRRLAKSENSRQDNPQVKTEGVSSTVEVSTSEFDGEKEVNLGSCESGSVFSASSLFPGFIGNDGVSGVKGMCDLLHRSSTPRSRMRVKGRRTTRGAIRPLSSLESCVMAQLYTEHAEMKEYMSGLFASPPMQTVRPFLVTDGCKVINRASGDAFIVRNNTVKNNLQTYSEENNAFSGCPFPLCIGAERRRDNTMEHFNLPRGSSDATLLLCLGMSFGIISSFMANRREVEKLNRMLKQTQNLVQDLEEELEMKDSLIMTTIDDNKSQRIMDGGSPNYSDNQEPSTNSNNKECVSQKATDECFSIIEAELEAELEMLELSMTSSTLQRRISNLVELDADFEPDVAEGELRADMLAKEDERGSSTTTPPANYAVSPRELSLRLHEVLESQLEERIRELEAEVESKRSQIQKSWSSSDANHQNQKSWSSSDENQVDEAVVLNLSGEALDAYNEACNEFAMLDDESDGLSDVEGTPMYEGEDDDEMEKLLIKQIVEKARQGSPVVLNAQRALFSE